MRDERGVLPDGKIPRTALSLSRSYNLLLLYCMIFAGLSTLMLPDVSDLFRSFGERHKMRL